MPIITHRPPAALAIVESTAIGQRPIDRRYVPAVRGIDLVQALNYVAVEDAGATFCYDGYTSSHLPYRAGDRPKIEAIAHEVVAGATTDVEVASRLMRWVAERVRWAGYYRRRFGDRLPSDRAMSEEELIATGFGWCNEQARVLCVLTQAVGLPSRIVFACDKRGAYGHCVTEVRTGDGWLTLDQSLGYAFICEGWPVRAVEVWGNEHMRRHFAPLYRNRCQQLIEEISLEVVASDFAMGVAAEPLDGFNRIGFHNHFLL